MPSIFDERRKELGLIGGDSISSPSQGSIFDERRMDLGLLEDTRPKVSKPTPAQQKQIMNEGRLNERTPKVSQTSVMKQKPATKSKFTHPADIDAPTEKESRKKLGLPENPFNSQPVPSNKLLRSNPNIRAATPSEPKPFENLRNLPMIGKVYRGLDALQEATEPAAKVFQEYYTPGAGLGAITAAERGAAQFFAKEAPHVSKLTRNFVTQGGIGAVTGAGQSLASHPERGLEGAKENAVFGAATGAALPVLGAGVKAGAQGLKKFATGQAEKLIGDQLAKASTNTPLRRVPRVEPAVPSVKPPVVSPPAATPEPVSTPTPQSEQVTRPQVVTNSRIDEIDDDFKKYKESIEQSVRAGVRTKEEGSRLIKGRAMRNAAEKRELIQGDSLINVPGGLTGKELENKIAKLRSNYTGKRVIVNGQPGTVTKMSFGKVGVKFDDGTERFFDQEQVKPETDIDALIEQQKKQSQPVKQEVPTREEPPQQEIQEQPTQATDELKFAKTVRKSEKTSPELAKILEEKPLTGARTTDKLNLETAKNAIEQHGIEGMANKLLAKKGKLSASEMTAAQLLAKHYSENGELEKAIEVISKTAREGREMGQAIQALSQWNKLTQEGAILLATRQLNRGVSNVEDWAKLTPEQAAPVKTAAQKIEQVDSARSLADDIVNMLSNKRPGETLTAAEKNLIKQFEEEVKRVNERVKPFIKQSSKSVIDEVSKVPPKERTRDQVVKLLDAKAERARERLNRAKNIGFAAVNQGNPVVDYAIIGAAHLAKGAVKFADFSEELVKDFGNKVKPYLDEAYTRAVRSFRKENGLPTDTELNKVISAAVRAQKLDKATAHALKRMASEIGFFLDDNLKREATQDLQLAMKSLGSSTLGEKLAAYQTSAMLLNLQTFLRNVGGTTQMLISEKVIKMFGIPIDMALSKLSGQQRTMIFRPKNQSKLFKDFMTGSDAGFKGVSPSGSLASQDVFPEAFKSNKNPFKWLTKLTGASIEGMDHAAYQKAAGEVLATFAEQAGKAQGLTDKQIKEQMPELIKKLDKKIYELADQAGEYATYQDETLLSRGAQKIKQGLNRPTDSLFEKAEEMGLPKWLSLRGFGAGDVVLKFAKTPANLVMRGIDYSPLGIIRSLYHLYPLVVGKTNKFDQFKATRSLARAITGTVGFTGLGFLLADAGILTGAASADKDERSIQEQSGQGAYKVNWSALRRWLVNGFDKDAAKFQKGDKIMDYAWLQPAAISVAMGVNANMAWKDKKAGDDKTLYDLVFKSLAGGLRTVMENPMVTGLSNVVDATQDLITRQDAGGFKRIAKGVPASFVPTLSNQLRTAVDNEQRETFDENILKEMLNVVQNKVPWWSKKLPASYNSLGKPRERVQGGEPNTFGQYLNAFVNPTKSTSFEVTPEAKLVLDVLQDSEDKGVLPRIGMKYIMVDNPETKKQKKLDLTKEQFSKLQRRMGEMTAEKLKQNSGYLTSNMVSAEKKAKKIKDILTSVGQKARNEIRVEQGFKKKRES